MPLTSIARRPSGIRSSRSPSSRTTSSSQLTSVPLSKAKELKTEEAAQKIKAVWVATKAYRSLVAPVLRDQVFMELCQAADQIRGKKD